MADENSQVLNLVQAMIGAITLNFRTHGIELDVKVIVDPRPIQELHLPGRVVFGRKE